MESHWGNRDPVVKGAHPKEMNAARGIRMRAGELSNEVWSLDIMLVLPGVSL
jgi:hypothetical protein